VGRVVRLAAERAAGSLLEQSGREQLAVDSAKPLERGAMQLHYLL
jgi:hypothetical protein